MNGRKAKERRRQTELVTTTPRDPALRGVAQLGHALGPHAGAYVHWQDSMKRALLAEMEKSRKALEQCTGDVGCPSSVHVPSCMAVR